MAKPEKPVLGWFTYLYDYANAIDPQGTESSWKRQDPNLTIRMQIVSVVVDNQAGTCQKKAEKL